MPTLYIASKNRHKLAEIQSILGNSWRIASALEIDPELDWVETGTTFHANALIKAQALRQVTQYPVLADDSGLEVDALGGEPGVYSARFAGPEASDEQNLQKLLDRLQGVPSHQRRARFICVLCYLNEEGEASYFKGTCEGAISEGSKGTQGFGYDPIFVPLGSQNSFAELSADEKNQISHRSQALSALRHFLKKT